MAENVFKGHHEALYDEFAAILQRDEFAACLSDETHVAVACSGGADSLALTLLLWRWCKEEGKKLTALIIDHGLREESAREAQAVRRELSRVGVMAEVPAEVLSATSGGDISSNIQAQARDLRYDLLSDYCRLHSIGCLFLGHHLQDQAETYLLRLRRGSHIKGLGCMDSVSSLSGEGEVLHLLRPLLSMDSARLLLLVEDSGLSWVCDPSNDSEAFERVRMRKLLPILQTAGLGADNLAASAEHMRLADDFIESQALPYIRRLQIHSCGYISGGRDLWRESHPLLHYVLLAYIWRHLGLGDYPPRARSLASLAESICSQNALPGRVLGGVMMFGRGDEVLFCREYAAMDREFYDLSKLPDGFLWDGRFRVSSDNCEGYYLGPGIEGLSDFGSDLPSAIRRVLPAIYHNGEICSSPLLGFYNKNATNLRASLSFSPAFFS